jgi:Carboxypeptidase regulatory-like domain/TonB dependent receptor
MRLRVPLPQLFVIVFLIGAAAGQSPNGTISGLVLDPSGRAITGAAIQIANDATGIKYPGATNGEGIYAVPNLPPGPYRIQVSKIGFKTLIKPDVTLNVQDALAINFTLPVGAIVETVTVQGGAPQLNTESGSVSTVVDRKYVENMPLNGRSLQDLILLTPGIVSNSPQTGATTGVSGEFSVNGQRTEGNYYTVDGVSANVGIAPGLPDAAGTTGSLPAPTALGTTQGLVSLDALEEFRVESSTYSAESGRNPGGQFSFVTRSGTNLWHGTAFDYIRNNVFDANDWFNNYFLRPLAAERQNDFGGTLGGPVELPGLYDGKDKTFFFFSYEGLRLDQPQAASVTYVPSAALRANTPAPLDLVLKAFPTPNGIDLGTGLAEFIGTWSNPASIDSTSIRLDHVISNKLRLFFRFSNTSSGLVTQGTAGVASDLASTAYTTRTYTFGATSSFSSNLSNEFRLNCSSNQADFSFTPSNFGGATAVNLLQLQGLAPRARPSPNVEVGLYLGGQSPTIVQSGESSEQKQWNLVDSLSVLRGRHKLAVGVDFRRLEPDVYQSSPVVIYRYFTATAVESNSVDVGVGESFAQAHPVYTNFSAFVQDEWKPLPRLSLSLGLRWEVNPAPGAPRGNLPYTVIGGSLSTLALAPQGTPLWKTDWLNFAPRFGAAYTLRNAQGLETVVRGGIGVFFDTGQQLGSFGYVGPGFSAYSFFGNAFGSPASFPVPPVQSTPPIVNPPVAPYGVVYAFPSHLQLPYTLQWNTSVQQALGKSQTLTLSYVGAHAARLLQNSETNVGNFNPNFTSVYFLENGLRSDYNALQIQFQRRLSRGLQSLASYTWAHSLDYGSYNFDVPYRRGDSDFDVRHSLTGAVMYDLPNVSKSKFANALLHHWGVDDRLTVRTGFPVPLQGAITVDPNTGKNYYSGLNEVPGQPFYIYGAQCAKVYASGSSCPGSRAINPDAFSLPSGCTPYSCPPGTAAGNAPRNFLRGFGAWQMDLAIRREFPIYERLKLQFRAEAFNILNHPNFGTINPTYCSAGPGCTFGQATATLANSVGGLNPVYQMGGPRSMQFALKLTF